MGQGQSRLKYQQAVGVLLAHPSLSPNDISFWSQFWTLPSSPNEVFEISAADIRSIKQQNPGNLAILLHKAIGQLIAWIQRTSSVSDTKPNHEFISALNCIRLITRILPFLFEDQTDGFVENVFWNNKLPLTASPSPSLSRSSPPPSSPFISSLPNTTRPSPPPHASIPNPSPPTTTSRPPSPSSSIPAPIPDPVLHTTPVTTAEPTSPITQAAEPVSEIQTTQENVESAVSEEKKDETTTEKENVEGKEIESGEEAKPQEQAASSETGEPQQQLEEKSAEITPPSSPNPTRIPLPQSPEPVNPASIPLPASPAPFQISLEPPASPKITTNPFEEDLVTTSLDAPAAVDPTPTPTPTTAPPAPTPTPQPPSPSIPPTPVIEWVENTLGGGDLPLAARLLDTLLHLLFLPHFTVSASPPSMQQIQTYQQSEDGNLAHAQLPFYYYWSVGVGAETVIPTPATSTGGTTLWANRTETLRCLLACFSQTLYTPPEFARTTRNRWLEHVVCKHGYFTKALFCSLVNVVNTYDPIGWGVPYNHLMFRDEHEGVASVALQVLNVLLQYNQHHFHYQLQQQRQRQYLLQQQQIQQQQLQQQQLQIQELQQQLSQQQVQQPTSPPSPIQHSRSFQQLHAQTSPYAQSNGSEEQERPSSPSRPPLTSSTSSSSLAAPPSSSSETPSIDESSPQHLHAQQLLSHSLQLQHAQQQLLRAQQPASSEQTQNFILSILADMKRNKDFQIIIDSFTRLMANPIVATAARLPYSVKQLEWHHHILMLFWYMIEDNKKFLDYLITSDKCPHLLVPMLCFMYENRKDASSLGVIQLCTFILLLLSGERDFAVSLNKPIVGARLPSDLPRPVGSNHYTHFDFLAVVAFRVLTDGGPTTVSGTSASATQHLAPVRECLLTAIANVSPFVKGIGMYASMSLVKLYEKLADPRVLFSSENTCRLVHLLLEIFNNIIQYQFEGNPSLIYAILRSQNEFSKLAHLKIVNPPAILPSAPTVVVPQTPQQQQLQQSQQLQQQQAQAQAQAQLQSSQQINPPASHFIPTSEWLEAWKRTLPLDVILRMITMVSPKIQSVCTGSFNAEEEQAVLAKLERTTLVGLLPAPHPILIRKYQSNDATQTWLLSYLWGSIFLQQSHPPLFFGTKVKLFVLHTN